MKTKKAETENAEKGDDYKYRNIQKEWLWNVRAECWDNANRLLEDSKYLLKRKRYPSSFFLSYTALEEFAKYIFVCDFINGMVSDDEFNKAFTSHKIKIAYAHSNAELKKENGKLKATIIYDETKWNEWFEYRNNSLYIGLNKNESITIPNTEITEDLAEKMYNRSYKEMRNILECECISERIGSAAFYK
jgi:AbiV family abortive infection protein